MSVGIVIAGGRLRRTVTMNLAVLRFPAWSVAEQVTRVVPSGKDDPVPGLQRTATDGSTASLAVGRGRSATRAPSALVARTVIAAGREIVGGIRSTTATVNVFVTVLP